MTDIDTQIESLLKEFLDAVDYTLEAPIEQADDAEFFDRPFKQATKAIKALLIQQKGGLDKPEEVSK